MTVNVEQSMVQQETLCKIPLCVSYSSVVLTGLFAGSHAQKTGPYAVSVTTRLTGGVHTDSSSLFGALHAHLITLLHVRM